MNRELIQYIMQRMAEWLDNRQMIVLQNTLDESMKMTESRQKTKSSEELLTEFIAAKRLEGRSEGTLAVYKNSIGQLLGYTDRNPSCTSAQIPADDGNRGDRQRHADRADPATAGT